MKKGHRNQSLASSDQAKVKKPISASQIRGNSSTTTSHAGENFLVNGNCARKDLVCEKIEKEKKLKFPCKFCMGDHLIHHCHAILISQKEWNPPLRIMDSNQTIVSKGKVKFPCNICDVYLHAFVFSFVSGI